MRSDWTGFVARHGRRLAAVFALAWGFAAQAAPPKPGELLFATSFEYPTAAAGGANYLWYQLDPVCDPANPDDPSSREPYGLLKNYATAGVRATAQQQLATMHQRGMRSLSLGASFAHNGAGGTNINSADPIEVGMAATNLANLLADAEAAGFERVLFRFFAQGAISPSNDAHTYTGSTDPLLNEYWNLVTTLRPVLVASGVPYKIDLMVEGAPRDDNSAECRAFGRNCKPKDKDWSQAVRELWRRYSTTYGTADTVGFSFFVTTADTLRPWVRNMDYVYAGVYPDTFALDVYGINSSEADLVLTMHNLMVDYGVKYGFTGAHWILSEAYNNDPVAAADFASAIAATRQPVDFLTEWPLDRAHVCNDVTVPPPYVFDIYRMYGF